MKLQLRDGAFYYIDVSTQRLTFINPSWTYLLRQWRMAGGWMTDSHLCMCSLIFPSLWKYAIKLHRSHFCQVFRQGCGCKRCDLKNGYPTVSSRSNYLVSPSAGPAQGAAQLSLLVNKERCPNLACGHPFLNPVLKCKLSATSKLHYYSDQVSQLSGNLRIAQVPEKKDDLPLLMTYRM